MARIRSVSVAGRVFLLQALALVLIAGVLLVVLVIDARRGADDDAASSSLAIARTIAVDPEVRNAVGGDDPTTTLQPFALEVLDATRVDFVTIMDPDGIRFTHPDPEQIGQTFLGTISEAQAGRDLTETYTGTLGPSIRAVVPVFSDRGASGDVVAIVAVGVTTERISATVLPRIPFVIGIALMVVLVGTAGAYLVQRGLRRVTGSMRPAELERMTRYYESVLHSVREGLVLTDREHRIVLYNDEAADLLGLPAAAEASGPMTAADLGIDPRIAELLESGRRVIEESHAANGTVLLVNQEPAVSPDRPDSSGGFVMTLRDQSTLQALFGELESVRTLSSTLRSQAHEHANSMHTLVSLLELGRVDAAIELAAESTRASQTLADELLGATSSASPALGALLLGKSSQAHERGVELTVSIDPDAVPPLSPSVLVSIVGNLVDNAIDAALAADAPRWVTVAMSVKRRSTAGENELRVGDSGTGPADPERAFELGVTSKPDDAGHGFGLAIVRDAVTAAGGTVAFDEGAPTTIVVHLPRTVS